MRGAQFAVFLLLAVVPVMAEGGPPAEPNPIAEPVMNAVTLASLPPKPQPQKVVDKKFIAVMATLGAAKGLSFATSTLIRDREREAGAPWATGRVSNVHMAAKQAAIYAGEVFIAYELKKAHSWLPGDKIIRKFWWVYPMWITQIHARTTLPNVRITASAGCTLPECQLR